MLAGRLWCCNSGTHMPVVALHQACLPVIRVCALLSLLSHALFHRNNVRSEARYIASFEPDVTYGTGFVPSLALLAKFGECTAAATTAQ
jgi:hypothetical protein